MTRKNLYGLLGLALGLTLLIGYFNHHFLYTFPFALLVSWGFVTGFSPTSDLTKIKQEIPKDKQAS